MAGQWIDVASDGKRMQTYVAAPPGEQGGPGVIAVQHAGGVDEFMRTFCERLAERGYVAAAPNLFHRQPMDLITEIQAMPPGNDRRQRLMPMLQQLTDAEMAADVNAALAYLRSRPDVGDRPIGITGFCMGGRVAFAMTTLSHELVAGAPFYPTNLEGPWDSGPSLIERAEHVSCPLVIFAGKEDQNPSPEVLTELGDALGRHGKQHEVHSYENAAHLFMDPRGDGYREHAATDAWARLLDFFERNLRAGVAGGR